MVEMPSSGTLSFSPLTLHQNDLPSFPESTALIGLGTPGQKTKVMKTNAGSPVFKGGWDHSHPEFRRQAYATRRQFSIEKLPEVFSQTPTHYAQQQRLFSTNSKTEVTV